MVNTILINNSHLVNNNGAKNTYSYKFNGGGLELHQTKRNQLAVAQLSIPFSFFNISDSFNNNLFYYIFNGNTYPVYLGNLYGDISTINKKLQQVFVLNGHYLQNALNDYVYFIEIEVNQPLYKIEIIFNVVPSTLPVNYSNPASMTLTGLTMQLQLPNNLFYKILGLTPSTTYPSATSASLVSQLSTTEIEVSPITAIVLNANIVNNQESVTPSAFFSWTPQNVEFGTTIAVSPPELLWVDCFNGKYQDLRIEFTDQLNRPIIFQDSGVCVMLALKSEDK